MTNISPLFCVDKSLINKWELSSLNSCMLQLIICWIQLPISKDKAAVSTNYIIKELAIEFIGFEEKTLINFSSIGPTFLLVHESERHA